MESFNLATRPDGYKLYGSSEPTSTEYALLGPDSLGRYYSVGQGAKAFIKQRDEHGEYSIFFLAVAAEQFRCGALDSWGRVWTGDIANESVQPHGSDGYPTTVVSLTDGAENFQPWGMLFDSEDGFLYVCGIGVVSEEIKLFRIDVTEGSEAVVAWSDGVASLVSPPIQESLDIAKDPNGDYWVAEGSRQGQLLRFSGGYLAPTLVSLSAAANRGLHRVHYAFEHLWVGSDSQQGVGAGDPQILKVQLDGTVVRGIAISVARRLGGFANDADNLYVACASFFGTGTSPNLVLVVNPRTYVVSYSLRFGGSSPTSPDGLGEPPRQLLVVTDAKQYEYPEPSFYDASLWLRGDDPQLSSYASTMFGVPNRGPQGNFPALVPRRGRPIVDGLNGIQAIAFDAARQDLRLLKKPTYSTKSVGFGVATERVNFGTTFDLEYTTSFSISVWARSAADVQQAILGKMQAPTTLRGYAVSLTAAGNVLFELYNDHGAGNRLAVQTTETGFNDGLWHHICVVCTGTVSAANTKIYVDNNDEPLTTIYNTLSATTVSTGEFWAGGRSAAGDEKWFNGLVSDLALYDLALAAGDVADIWNEGAPGDLALLSTVGNLTAWWRMGTGDTYPKLLNMVAGSAVFPTIPDASPSGNDGTMTGMTASNFDVSVPWGKFCQYSLAFNGTNQYITMGNVVHFEYNLPFSISFWFRATSTGANLTMVGKVAPATTYRGWWVALVVGQIRWVLANDSFTNIYSEIRTTGVFNDGEWHHVVCTYTAATPGAAADMNIIVDGVDVPTTVVSSALGSNTILNSSPLNFASYNNGAGNFFPGYLTEMAFYDKALSLAEAQWIYNSGEPRDLRLPAAPSDLAVWWRLGAAMDTPQSSWYTKIQQWVWSALTAKETVTITDASPFVSTGTLYNMVAGDVTTDTPGGISRFSCTFDGINKGMFCNVAAAVYGGQYTFGGADCSSWSGWVKTTALSGWLWGNGTNSVNWQGYGVFLDGTGKPAFVIAVNFPGTIYRIRSTSATVNDGAWHHVVWTNWRVASNSYVTKLYIDGVEQATTVVQANNGNSSVSGSGFSIGARNLGLYDPLAGQVDEVSVWNKPLSQDDVDAIFNSGAPPDLRDTPCVDHLRGWWRMGDPYEYAGTPTNMTFDRKRGFAPGTPGFTKRSLYFDAINDYVTVGNVPEIDFEYNEPFSVSAWVFSWSLNAYRTVASKCTGYTASGWIIDYYGGTGGITYHPMGMIRVVFTSVGGTGQGFFEVSPGSSDRPLPFGVWFHLTMTYDGSNSAAGIKFYINGELWPTQVRYNTAFSSSLRNGTAFNIGGTSGYWSGYQDEVSVWDKELSQADVTEIYNSGDPDDLSAHTSVANLVGWWRMGEGAADGTMVNMAPRALAPEAPEEEEEVDDLHTEGELTILVAFTSTNVLATQTIFSTMDSALTQSSVGAALYYDGTAENVRLVVANGSGSSWAVDHTTAAGSVPQSTPILLAIRLDPAATPALNIRIWVTPQLLEFVEETAALAGSFSSGAGGKFSVGFGPEGTLEGAIGEAAITRRKLPDAELLAAVRYLRRWLP